MEGADFIGTGDTGIGNTTSSAAIVAVITRQEVNRVTERGTGIDDAGLAHKRRIVATALDLHRPDSNDARDVLAKVGGFEIGGLAGVI